MATVFAIWSRKERCLVPTPFSTFPTSQAAQDHIRRIIGKTGDTKDQQTKTYDVLTLTV